MLRLLATTVEAMSAEPDRLAAVENEANLLVTAAERSVVEQSTSSRCTTERAALEHLLLRRRTALFEASG